MRSVYISTVLQGEDDVVSHCFRLWARATKRKRTHRDCNTLMLARARDRSHHAEWLQRRPFPGRLLQTEGIIVMRPKVHSSSDGWPLLNHQARAPAGLVPLTMRGSLAFLPL